MKFTMRIFSAVASIVAATAMCWPVAVTARVTSGHAIAAYPVRVPHASGRDIFGVEARGGVSSESRLINEGFVGPEPADAEASIVVMTVGGTRVATVPFHPHYFFDHGTRVVSDEYFQRMEENRPILEWESPNCISASGAMDRSTFLVDVYCLVSHSELGALREQGRNAEAEAGIGEFATPPAPTDRGMKYDPQTFGAEFFPNDGAALAICDQHIA